MPIATILVIFGGKQVDISSFFFGFVFCITVDISQAMLCGLIG